VSLSSRQVTIGRGLKCGLGHGCLESYSQKREREREEMKIGLGSIMGGFTNDDDMDRT
jgi:hypothetical protein